MGKGTSDVFRPGDGAAGGDGEERSATVGVENDYHRLVEEQRRELEELKRAARAASPSNTDNSRYPPDTGATHPPVVAYDDEPQRPLPPAPPPSRQRTPHNGRPERYAGVGVGGDFLAAVTRRRTAANTPAGAVGTGGDGGGTSARGDAHCYRAALTTADAGGVRGHGSDLANGESSSSRGIAASGLAAPRTRGASGADRERTRSADQSSPLWQEDQQPPEPLPPTRRDHARPSGAGAEESKEGKKSGAVAVDTQTGRDAGSSGSGAPAVRFVRSGEATADSSAASPNGSGAVAGPSAIADEALASLGAGAVVRSVSGAPPRIAYDVDAVDGSTGGRGVGIDSGRRAPYYSSSMEVEGFGVRSAGRSSGGVRVMPDARARKIRESGLPPPLKAAPTATERQPHPTYNASRSPTAPHHDEGAAGAIGLNGRDGDGKLSSAYLHRDTKRLAYAGLAGLAEHGSPGDGAVGSAPRPFVGSSWGAGDGGWSVSRGSFHHGDLVAGGGVARGEPFRSASWAEKLVSKREEQSVLVRQLERELASTVSALRDERKERRGQTEALRSKLDKSRGTVRDLETELERRERMATTLMGELEALRLRCDRLSSSREERAQEADKTMARLREDNRELEARLRQADAAAAEARAARAGADAERIRAERELQASLEKVTSAERRAQDEAEAAERAAGEAARELQEAREGRENLRSELDALQRRVEEEGTADAAGALRAQVADLERLLATANQRCVALEARLGLLERELVEAEGGEVEARARLRWALGQLGIDSAAASAAAGADSAAAAADAADAAGQERKPATASPAEGDLAGFVRIGLSGPRDRSRKEEPSHVPPETEKDQEAENDSQELQEGEEEEEEEEEKFREPNWRSMVPVLFPRGWRDREIAAAAARIRNSAARGQGVLDSGTAAAAAAAAAVGSAPTAPGYPGRPVGVPHKTIDARGTRKRLAESGRDWGDGAAAAHLRREEEEEGGSESGSGGGGGVTLDEPTKWGGGGGRAISPVDAFHAGGESTEEGVRSALDRLTAEERSFAYTGGVETEYGRWQLGENPLGDDRAYGVFETEISYAAAAGGDAEKDRHHAPGRHRDGTTLPDGNLLSASRRRSAVTSRGPPAGAGTAGSAGSAAAVSKTPLRKSSRGTATTVVGRSPLKVSAQGHARRRAGPAAAPSPGAESMGRSGRRLRVRVPVPRGAATTIPGPGAARVGRPPSHPDAVSRRRASLSSSTTPSRIKPSSSNSGGVGTGASATVPKRARGSGAGVPLKQRPRRQAQSSPPPAASRRQGPLPPSSGGGGRRRAAAAGRESDGSWGGYLDTDLSLGSATATPRRAWRTPSGGGGSRTGTGNKLGTRVGTNTAELGRRGATARGDEKSSAARRPPKPIASSREAPAGGSRGGAREHISLMRRRRERGGLGSSFASSRTVGGGGGDRRSARGGGGLSGGGVNISTCSSGSRAWRP